MLRPPSVRWFVILSIIVLSFGPAFAQTIDEEIDKVREAIETSTNLDQQKALQDYLNILEINASRQNKPTAPVVADTRIDRAIEQYSLGAFQEAVRSQAPTTPSHLAKVVTEYQKVCHSPKNPATTFNKKALLQMAEILLKAEVANTGTRSQMLSNWFEFFYILAPTEEGDDSCSDLFEMLLVYMPDELTTYRRPLDGMSLLHLYAFPPVEAYLSLMLKLGFDKTVRNVLGQTPLDYLNSEVVLLKARQPDLFYTPNELTTKYASNSEEFIANRIKENALRNEQIDWAQKLLSLP